MTDTRKPPLELVRKDGSTTESYGPANGTRPPFEPGNTAALTHGARSPRSVEAKVQELRAALFEVAPDLDTPRFAETIERYLRSLAREKLLHDYLMEKGPENAGQRLWEGATASANASQRMADALGLTPAGFHKLKELWGAGIRAEHDVAALQGLAATGQALREQANRADALEAEAVDDGEGDE